MADYLITGKKGNGKSLVVVGRIIDALKQGRPVATNLDLFPENFLRWDNKSARIYRLPDRPTAADLELIGCGNSTIGTKHYDEEKNGLLVLDELSTFMNARDYTDKGRKGVLDWLAHSRKLGWDTYMIAQGRDQVDKQLREALCEYLVICRRMDRLRIPFIPLRLPRFHVAFVRFGMSIDSVAVERWIYRGTHLFKAYDTFQRLTSSYPHGVHCVLPPGYFSEPPGLTGFSKFVACLLGRYKPKRVLPARHYLSELLMRLPPDDRVKHFRRLDSLGAFGKSVPVVRNAATIAKSNINRSKSIDNVYYLPHCAATTQ